MTSENSWSGRSHLSIEGIEVVPANELEVVYDNTLPEVVENQWNEKTRSVTLQSVRKREWRRKKVFRVPLLRLAIGIIAFMIGIAIGSVVVTAIVSRERREDSSQAHDSQSSTHSSTQSTFSDPFRTTPGVLSNSVQTLVPSTQSFIPSTTTFTPVATTPTTVGAVQTDQTNFQKFTGSIGVGAAAVTATGNSSAPYATDDENYPDLATALAQSCANQHDDCAVLANGAGAIGLFTVQDCDNQQASCLDVNGSELSTTEATAAPTAAASTSDSGFFITMFSLR